MRTFQILQQLFAADHETFVTGLFKEFLNRDPAPEDLVYFTHCLKSGSKSKNRILKIILRSTEFAMFIQKLSFQSPIPIFHRFMKMDEETFVTEVYREYLGRDPDLGEFQHFVHLLKTRTPKLDVLRTVLLSKEALMIFQTKRTINNKNPSVSIHYSDLWPQVPINKVFRDNVKTILRNHNFPHTTNILVKTGGVGDFVQMTPVAKALKIKDAQRPIVAVVGHYGSLFDDHPYIDLAIECGSMSDRQAVKSVVGLSENVFDLRYISRAYGTWKNTDYYYKNLWYYNHFPHSGIRVDNLNKHVCDLMLYSLGLEQYTNCNDVFIKPDLMIEKIQGDYFVLSDSPGSIPGQLKQWSTDGWDGLIKWLHLNGIIPIQLGLATDSLLHPEIMDLRGKTTPRQAAGYLKLSKGYIGIEGGLFHLAKAVGAPAVVIFASTSETCFAYPDTHVVTKRLCRPCWWNDTWTRGKCVQGSKTCLNLPDWESVAAEVSKILEQGNKQNK
ncbi:DUF4214 domain-containing protein [Marinisporobacter balticus]|uniref:ADP-heptose:LPS heptosyltransferase n=1 Tax=Marinisporobacter balticus TaxID=2018667 RepID=A0A4R2KYS9_9FIRM|nr:DUF4214 domain-containing protein [Marinisporobacter balticus]TCO79053.1 ADP-heptose:LPS heptosyltransferase [Marinisporobacter balticus]